jgi:transposase
MHFLAYVFIIFAVLIGAAASKFVLRYVRGGLRKLPRSSIFGVEWAVRCADREVLKKVKPMYDIVRMIERFSARIEERIQPFFACIPLLDTITGINLRGAEDLIAEIGMDMGQFPTVKQLGSWAGMCPGNNESGGKRRSGKTPKGSTWLRAVLSEAARAAARKKGSYCGAQYRRLVRRRGKKRAIVAVGHSILTIAYYVLKNQVKYQELGEDYFDKLNNEHLRRHYVKRLESLGYSVDINEVSKVA